jgi:hypothetical protein
MREKSLKFKINLQIRKIGKDDDDDDDDDDDVVYIISASKITSI